MPPKPATATAAAAAAPPGWAFPKSDQKSISIIPVTSYPPSSATAAIPQLAPASRESRPPYAAAPAHQAQALASWGLAKSDALKIGDNRNEESWNSVVPVKPGVGQFGPGKIIPVETLAGEGSGGGSMSADKSSSVQAGRSQLHGEVSVDPVTMPDYAVDSVARPSKVKRRIVKKVVRVVKKVIKKRVPKRVLMRDSEDQELLLKAVTSLDFGNISNSVDDLLDKPSIVSEAEEVSDTADEIAENSHVANDDVIEAGQTSSINEALEEPNLAVKEISNVVNCVSVLEPIISDDDKDASGVFCESTREQVMPANDQSGVNTSFIDNINNNDGITFVPDTMEVTKVSCIAENVVDITDDRTFVESEKPSFEGGNDYIRSNEGPDLGDENEVLERKGRRKTEIFVGGLEGHTKEENIRKVFEEFGLIMEVRLVMSGSKGRHRGYAFVQFASADAAKNALARYSYVEICGKQCNVEPSGGNDTIYLGNIDKNWKTEDLVTLLEKHGIKNIDKVTLKPDPNNVEKNRGFAFLEFKTSKAAQIVFEKLQKNNTLGKDLMLKIAWAHPVKEEKLKTSDYVPNKDALPIAEAVSRETLNVNSSKVNISIPSTSLKPKGTQTKRTAPGGARMQLPKAKPTAIQNSTRLHEPTHEWKLASTSYDAVEINNQHSSITDELVQILRQQSSNRHIHPQPHPTRASNAPDLHFPSPGTKRPFSSMEYGIRHVEPPGLSRARMEHFFPISSPSSSFRGEDALPFPGHPQQRPPLMPGDVVGGRNYPSSFQEREETSYNRSNDIYRRY